MTVESLLRALGDEIEDAEEGKSVITFLNLHFFTYTYYSFSYYSPLLLTFTPLPLYPHLTNTNLPL